MPFHQHLCTDQTVNLTIGKAIERINKALIAGDDIPVKAGEFQLWKPFTKQLFQLLRTRAQRKQ